MRATETSIPDDVALASLSAQVGERLRASHQMLVTAESCTGGWIAKMITDIPGCVGLVRLRPGRLQLRGEAGVAGRAAGDARALRRGEPRDGARDGVGRADHLRRHAGGGRDGDRRARRKYAGQAGRHGVDRPGSAAAATRRPRSSTSTATARRCGGRRSRRRCRGCWAPCWSNAGVDGHPCVSSNTTNHGPDRYPASHPRPDRRAHRARRAAAVPDGDRPRLRLQGRARGAVPPRGARAGRRDPAHSRPGAGHPARAMPVDGAGRRRMPRVPNDDVLRLPVLGRVAAGVPIGADVGGDSYVLLDRMLLLAHARLPAEGEGRLDARRRHLRRRPDRRAPHAAMRARARSWSRASTTRSP